MRYAFVNPSNSCQPIKPLDGGIVMLSIGVACYKYMITYIRGKKMNVLPEKHHGFATNQRVNSATCTCPSSHHGNPAPSPGLKVKLLLGPTSCKIPRSTQRSCSGIRRSPKMCQAIIMVFREKWVPPKGSLPLK